MSHCQCGIDIGGSVGMILKGNPSMTMSLFVLPMICEPLTGRTEMKAVDL